MLRDTSGDDASILVSPHCKVATQQLSSASAQLSRVVYRSKVGRFGWLLQNATKHLLVIASICRETPPKNLKFPSTLSSFFLHHAGLFPSSPSNPRPDPGPIHIVCVVSKVWVRDPYRGSEEPNFTNSLLKMEITELYTLIS